MAAGNNSPLECAASTEKTALQNPSDKATVSYNEIMAGNPQPSIRAMEQAKCVPNMPMPVLDLVDIKSSAHQANPKNTERNTAPAPNVERQTAPAASSERLTAPGIGTQVIKPLFSSQPEKSADKSSDTSNGIVIKRSSSSGTSTMTIGGVRYD
jgi:hypothetical protein